MVNERIKKVAEHIIEDRHGAFYYGDINGLAKYLKNAQRLVMNTTILLKRVCIGFLILFTTINCYSQSQCDYEFARNLSRVYCLSLPISGNDFEFYEFIVTNPDLFSEDGPLIAFADRIGRLLISEALNTYNPSDWNRTYERVIDMGGTIEDAHEISNRVNSGEVRQVMIGYELIWLADVLPDMANDDWTSFNTTGTPARKLMRQYEQFIIPLINSDPNVAAIWKGYLQQLNPFSEWQMSILFIMVCE